MKIYTTASPAELEGIDTHGAISTSINHGQPTWPKPTDAQIKSLYLEPIDPLGMAWLDKEDGDERHLSYGTSAECKAACTIFGRYATGIRHIAKRAGLYGGVEYHPFWGALDKKSRWLRFNEAHAMFEAYNVIGPSAYWSEWWNTYDQKAIRDAYGAVGEAAYMLYLDDLFYLNLAAAAICKSPPEIAAFHSLWTVGNMGTLPNGQPGEIFTLAPREIVINAMALGFLRCGANTVWDITRYARYTRGEPDDAAAIKAERQAFYDMIPEAILRATSALSKASVYSGEGRRVMRRLHLMIPTG